MTHPATDTETVRYQVPRPKVARITLARPQRRDAQNAALLCELNVAFDVTPKTTTSRWASSRAMAHTSPAATICASVTASRP
jgi:hypothetical protein